MDTHRNDTNPLEQYFKIREDPETANQNRVYYRLDVISSLQTSLAKVTFVVCMIFFSALGFYVDGTGSPVLIGGIAAITAALLLMNLTLECTYVLDTGKQAILYYRKVCGFAKTWRVCSYEEVQQVGMNHANHYSKYEGAYTAYHVVLQLKNKKAFIISRPARFFEEADELAQAMADTFQAEYVPSTDGGTTIDIADTNLLTEQIMSISLPGEKWTVDSYLVFILFLFTVAVAAAAFGGTL